MIAPFWLEALQKGCQRPENATTTCPRDRSKPSIAAEDRPGSYKTTGAAFTRSRYAKPMVGAADRSRGHRARTPPAIVVERRRHSRRTMRLSATSGRRSAGAGASSSQIEGYFCSYVPTEVVSNEHFGGREDDGSPARAATKDPNEPNCRLSVRRADRSSKITEQDTPPLSSPSLSMLRPTGSMP
jgi:hypothetical protein